LVNGHKTECRLASEKRQAGERGDPMKRSTKEALTSQT